MPDLYRPVILGLRILVCMFFRVRNPFQRHKIDLVAGS